MTTREKGAHDDLKPDLPLETSPLQGEWVLVPKEPTEEMLLGGMAAPRSEATAKATNTLDRHAGIAADIYRAMIAAAPSPQGEWRPISTAPKDGTLVDLLYPYPHGRTINCFWDDVLRNWAWRTPQWDGEELLPEEEWWITTRPNMRPTHWRAAPSLPCGGVGDQGDSGSSVAGSSSGLHGPLTTAEEP